MLNRRHFSLAAGAAATLGGFGIARAQGDMPLVLGQSAPFTGPAAQLGIQFHQGAKLFLDQYNAQPGRRNVVIKNLDDGYEPDRCAANTQKLIDEDVFALFGYVGTPTSLAALPLAAKDKVPFVAPFTGAMSLREPFQKNVFHLRASYNDETALMVKQLTHLGLKKIAVFYQNDAYGKAGLDGVTLALAEQQLKPVALATVERNSADVAQAVKTIVAARPDAVVQVGAYKACAAFIREARKAVYGGTFFNVPLLASAALWCGWGSNGALQAEPVEQGGRKVYPLKGKPEDLDGVMVFNPQGKPLAHIRLPERCANLCFGGPKRNRLYMASSHSLYALYVEAHGAV